MVDRRRSLLNAMQNNPKNVKFADIVRLCDDVFGRHRQKGSHLIWSTGQASNPLVTLQSAGPKAKPYQVRQVIKAVSGVK